MNRVAQLLSAAFVTCVIFGGCYYDKEDELYPPKSCDTTNATYQADVLPILNSSCATSGCHLPGGLGPGDYSTYAGLHDVILNGHLRDRVVVTKDMPASPFPPLTKCQIARIEAWLNNGAPEN